ncbi:hypothetical protein BO86DRAFT_399829 [Aspergillus japonicus CBS 114.51]|uniref:Uncharacterized protein n=1 Tax=Aspergillus japonicus CBS 114.51 TaxID=1448312 RepID=A0A8T8X0N3_ASPJA|nr:hypothetical protein BO86DRAFT_399829 [Aspergillus japonicus CBS 114.51]RAH81696.1 hypothetical protein BO86DRAFT_399829 [Aspergillus japonicus CBS 114.51]
MSNIMDDELIFLEMLPDNRLPPRWRHTTADRVAMVVDDRTGTQYASATIEKPYWQMYTIFCGDAGVQAPKWMAVQQLLFGMIRQRRKKHPDLLPLMGSIETPEWVQLYRDLVPGDDVKHKAFGLHKYDLRGKERFFRGQDEDELTELWYSTRYRLWLELKLSLLLLCW